MRYALLGRSGVRVSRIALGAAFFGTRIERDDCARILDRALELGVNVIDTAEFYLPPERGVSESILGGLLRGRREAAFLATKVHPRGWHPEPVNRGLSRRVVMQAVEGSLRRLQTDHVDLLYAHAADPSTPLEETLAAFDDLVRAGKVRYAALSNHSAAQVVEALWTADRLALRPIMATQDLYNLLERGNEAALYPVCRRHGIGVFAYSPLAGGVLSGKYTQDVARGTAAAPGGTRADYFLEPGQRVEQAGAWPKLTLDTVSGALRLKNWAEARGRTAAQVALAWVLGEPAVTSAILGVTTLDQLEANAPAFDLELTPEEREEVARLVAGA